ncbi:MAG TPA: S-layer homology domain-containing protein, partial [Anaerovoracaceae bacterium]|nr:S-layer homology domain-containing protein [Anaerovoracaceae bacterium]
MKKIISTILILTLILSLAPAVFAEETETVGGKITLTQFLGTTLDNTKGITLSYGGTTITANASDFYAIADKIVLTSQFDIEQTNMDGLYITARKHDESFEYAYITANGEADKYSQAMSRLPYVMYVADDKELMNELISLVTGHWSMFLPFQDETISRANAEGFIPENFGVSNYTQDITREKFCDLAFFMLHKKIGMEHNENIGAFLLKDDIEAMDYVENVEDYSLKNTVSKSIITLYHFNIINGKKKVLKPVEQDGYPFSFIDFAPDDFITREAAATMLNRMAIFLKSENGISDGITYADSNDISDWAKDSINKISKLKLMQGVGSGNFLPKGNYTIEQAIATMIRFFDIPSYYEKAANVVRQYFDAYEKSDYETMKQYSTARHVKQDFHDGDVWGNKWAKSTSIQPVNRATDNDECIFNVSVEMETVSTSSQ